MFKKKNKSNEPKADKPKPKIIKTVCCDAMVKCKGSEKNRKYYCTACGAEVTSKGKPKA